MEDEERKRRRRRRIRVREGKGGGGGSGISEGDVGRRIHVPCNSLLPLVGRERPPFTGAAPSLPLLASKYK